MAKQLCTAVQRDLAQARRSVLIHLPAVSRLGIIANVSISVRPGSDSLTGDMTLGELLGGARELPAEGEWLALIQAMVRRDPEALRALHNRSHRLVFTMLMRIFRDQRTVGELTVRVYQTAWESAGTYTPRMGSVLGWLMNVTRTVAVEQLQHQLPLSDQGYGQRLAAALGRLNPTERELIELVYFSSATIAEAASRMKLSVDETTMRVHSALESLCEVYVSPENP